MNVFVIVGETHHKIPPENFGDFSDVIDVTIPLQSLVRDSRLELLGTTKVKNIHICIFYDNLDSYFYLGIISIFQKISYI